MAGYVVYVDEVNAADPMVHTIECTYYQNRKQDTNWLGPYSSFAEAWKTCFSEAQSRDRIPQTHSCVKR